MHIAEFLAERQVAFEPLPHAPAFTAQKRAKSLGVKGGQVAKAVLLRGPHGLLLAVLPATHHIDAAALERHLGGAVRLASAAEAVRVFHDCEWGVVPAFGNLYGLTTLLDESITPDMPLVLETNTHVEAVRLPCRDFERLAGARRLAFARKGVMTPPPATVSRRSGGPGR
jgi:Ala-tRNA(Pro) deacylase